jgi:hypothetical protein
MGKKMRLMTILFAILIFTLVGVLIVKTNERNDRIIDRIQRCEAGGWTWLSKEGKCIMVKELK